MSICYSVMTREQLFDRLKPTGILGHRAQFGLKTGYINDEILNLFYERVEKYGKTWNATTTGAGQVQIAVNEANAPSSPNPTDMMLLNEMQIVEMYRLTQSSTGSDYDVTPVINGLAFVSITIPYISDPVH